MWLARYWLLDYWITEGIRPLSDAFSAPLGADERFAAFSPQISDRSVRIIFRILFENLTLVLDFVVS